MNGFRVVPWNWTVRSCSSQLGHTLSFLEALRSIEEKHATSPGLVAVLEDDVRLLPAWR